MNLASSWQFWAVLSAVFAALTAIFAKIGVENVNSDFATFIRTIVILATLAFILLATGQFQSPGTISSRTYLFLLLSGLATGASWICYFRALKIGEAAKVAPIDKLSVVLVAVFGVLYSWREADGAELARCRVDRGGCNPGRLPLIECFLDRQEIAPREALLQRTAQQECRVKRRHGPDLTFARVEGKPAPACFGDPLPGVKERLR